MLFTEKKLRAFREMTDNRLASPPRATTTPAHPPEGEPPMKARVILASLCLAFMVMAAMSASAQTFRGAILGTVTDASGAVVSGANVTAKNEGNGLERSTQSAPDGAYSLRELPIGTYTVTVKQTGFQTFVTSGVVVEVASERRVDAALRPGQVSSQVVVSADEIPLVETTSNTLGGTLRAEEFNDLPVNGRDYMKMLTAIPGANADPSSVNDSPGSFGVFSVNGNRGRSNNFLLDGTDMNDGFRNDNAINEGGVFGIPATLLPVDAIQ